MKGCAELCSAAGEPLAGSAGPVAAWIGIAWPKPLWDADDVLRSQGLPPELGERIAERAAGGVKLAVRLFQSSARPSTERCEVVLWRPGAAGGQAELAPGEIAPRIERFLDGDTRELAPLGPRLFVCTDGKHDRCCAELGRPVYESLRLAAQAHYPQIRVAECSHLGGHRFATNCLALPGGQLYGRVTREDCAELLRATAEQRPWTARLRGTLSADPLAEIAALLLEREHGGQGYALTGAPEKAGADRLVPARIRTSDGERAVRVRCILQTFTGPTSCGDGAVETGRWIASSIESA